MSSDEGAGLAWARPSSSNPLREIVYSEDGELLDPSTETQLHSHDGDCFETHFQSTRKAFETRQPNQERPQSATTRSSFSGDSSAEAPVGERIEAFSSLKKRFENDANNNAQQTPPPRSMKYSSYNVTGTRDDSSPPGISRRRSSDLLTEFNDARRRSSEMANEMALVRERIAVAKAELAEATERREVANQGRSEAKSRIVSAKQQSRTLRERARATEELIERKEIKVKALKKRLETRTMVAEQNQRALAYCNKDIEHESGLLEAVSEKVDGAKERRRSGNEKVREAAKAIGPLKRAIANAEERTEKSKNRARRSQDILNKSTIRLKNARTLSAEASKRVSFNGYRIEDARKMVNTERERTKRAQSDMSYLEYRRELLVGQLEEYQEDIRKMVIRLNPHRQQKALGFNYTRLPMSEEL